MKVIIPPTLGPKLNYGTWHSAIHMFHNYGEIEESEWLSHNLDSKLSAAKYDLMLSIIHFLDHNSNYILVMEISDSSQ